MSDAHLMRARPICIVTNALYEGVALACAVRLAAADWDIVITHRPTTRRAPEVVSDIEARIVGAIEEMGAQCVVFRVETSDFEAGRQLVHEVVEKVGPIKAVINGEGARAYPPQEFQELCDDDWHDALDREVLSGLGLIRCALPAMAKGGGGRIINLTYSRASWENTLPLRGGHAAVRNSWAFLYSKEARAAIAGVLWPAAYRSGVTINNLAPGRVRNLPLEELCGCIRRNVRPSEVTSLDVADVATFLCSPAGRGVTGASIPVVAAPVEYEYILESESVEDLVLGPTCRKH